MSSQGEKRAREENSRPTGQPSVVQVLAAPRLCQGLDSDDRHTRSQRRVFLALLQLFFCDELTKKDRKTRAGERHSVVRFFPQPARASACKLRSMMMKLRRAVCVWVCVFVSWSRVCVVQKYVTHSQEDQQAHKRQGRSPPTIQSAVTLDSCRIPTLPVLVPWGL